MAHRNIFTGEWVLPEPPKKKVRTRPVAERVIRPAYVGYRNDIDGWYRENRPTTEGCQDLRAAMKRRKQFGDYLAQSYEASTGRKLIKITGPVGVVRWS